MKHETKPIDAKIIILLLILISLIGVGTMLYPRIAAKYAESVRSEIQTQYEEVVSVVDTSELDAVRASAEAYNNRLFSGEISPLEPEENGYYTELQLPSTEVMCYIIIPKINVYLPVYHGIGTDALGKGAGHMPQSSLPVGGLNTHTVITAHSGMAQSPMFSDLEQLEIGDIFQIQVLGETLTYEVDTINVVLPQEVDAVQIQLDKDLASLVTCTPYGVNTHRLVVTGHRVENPIEEIQPTVSAEQEEVTTSVWTDQYWQSIKIGAGIAIGSVILAVILYFALMYGPKKQRKQRGKYEQ